MTTSPDQAVLRTILVHPHVGADSDVAGSHGLLPTHRLLRDRGHDVTSTESLEEAVAQMQCEPVDLLIVEQPDSADNDFRQRTMEQVESLPVDQQPRNVAMIVPQADESDCLPSLIGPRVHLLLKPLHMHGLLHVLRNLENDR